MHVVRAVLAVSVLIGGLMMPDGDLYLAAPAAILGVFLVLWEVLRAYHRLHWVIVFVVPVFGLLAFNRLAVAPLTEYGHEKFSNFVTLTFFSALAACLIRPGRGFVAFAKVWITAGVYLTGASLLTGTGLRAAAFGANPIWVARPLAAAIVLIVWLWYIRKLRVGWAVLLGLVMLVGIFAAGSRGPLMGAAAGVLVLLLAGHMRTSRKILSMVGIGVVMIGLFQLPVVKESRIIGLATGEIAGDQTRNLMWSESFRMIRENPWGVGLGNWGLHTTMESTFIYPHNIFLEVFVEHGVIVGVFFAAITLCVLMGLLRRARNSFTALGASSWLVTEIVNVSVSGDLNARTFFFALTLAFLVTRHREDLQEARKAEVEGNQLAKA